MAYTLAKPTFSSGGPKEALAAVDVYKQTTGEVVNSYQEMGPPAPTMYDRLTVSDAKDLAGQITDKVKTAANVASALARGISSGDYFSAAAGGIGALGAKAGGLLSSAQGLLGMASKIQGAVRSLGQAKSISQILGTGGAYLGQDGAALTKLSSSSNSLERNLSSFKNISKLSNLNDASRALTLGAGMSTAVGSILGDMSPSATMSYNAAAASALELQPSVTLGSGRKGRLVDAQNARNAATVASAVSEFTGGTYKTNVSDSAGLAGSVAGLAYVAHQTGLPGTFQALTADIEDERVCKAAALPLMRAAATDGDMLLFMDVSKSKVGSQMGSAIPEAASGIISTVKPPPNLAQQEYANQYDEFGVSLDIVDPAWKEYPREGGQLVKATYVAQNPFMQDMIGAKLNSAMGPATSNAQSVYPLNPANDGEASYVSAPFSWEQNTQAFYADLPANATKVQADTPPEAFMMLGGAFNDESVDKGLETHFPSFYQTLDEPIMGIPC